eukprot:scaffold64282_cov18-Tisochrysis_lutea.AAC.3
MLAKDNKGRKKARFLNPSCTAGGLGLWVYTRPSIKQNLRALMAPGWNQNLRPRHTRETVANAQNTSLRTKGQTPQVKSTPWCCLPPGRHC